MSGGPLKAAVWALAVLTLLAPSAADGNIGCLYSASLCAHGVEWCYDDSAFGKCIPVYGDEPDEASLYQYKMSIDELKSFETVLQKLLSLGYRWENAYTQCVLQAMLLSSQRHLTSVNMKVCEQFSDPDIISESNNEDNGDDVDPDELAYIRFTPNESPEGESDFASEVYAPPVHTDRVIQFPVKELPIYDAASDGESSEISDELLDDIKQDDLLNSYRQGVLNGASDENPYHFDNSVIDVVKIKKSYDPEEENFDEDGSSAYESAMRSLASLRKLDVDVPPYTTEYITANRFSPEEAQVLSNAMDRYLQRFQAKEFPFEYEEENNDIPESRVYVDEDDEHDADVGSGQFDPYKFHPKGKAMTDAQKSNMEYLLSLWKNNVLRGKKPLHALDAEGGSILDLSTESTQPHTTPVKKDIGGQDYDPSYVSVYIKHPYSDVTWSKGIRIINKTAELLGLSEKYFINPRVEVDEVVFQVEKNPKNMTALDVARNIEYIRDQLENDFKITVFAAGLGDTKKGPPIWTAGEPGFLSNRDNILVILVACGVVVAVAGGALIMLIRRDAQARRKLAGLASAAQIDAEATQDYQELCRARMTGGKWSGQQTGVASGAVCGGDAPQRIASLSKESDHNSPSARSSTSSWSEEPALTNMDISTGHMVLAYMEDHLKNKDRLEQEWSGLCAYEAEPCATTAASADDNVKKNRNSQVLPYDHSRVILNTLTNQHGSDYINASTITDHDPRNPAYIAAQGPLEHTAADFWQMVWEQGSVVMVMLTRLTENGTQMCHRYWPEEASELYHIYEVHLVSEHIWCDDYLVRSFYLKNQRTGETRTVTQFHFLSWPDAAVPASTKALLEFRRKVNKSYRGRSCPIVVHCSDGASRTGTYCLIDMVLNRMAKGAKEIDIAATLEHIRDQRPRMVTTKQQFEFVLMAVAEEVHAILKALPAQLQQHEKKDKEASDKDKTN